VAAAAAPLSWSAPLLADSSSGAHTTAVSCPAVGLCVAVDEGGNAVYTTAPTTGPWSAPVPIDTSHELASVSCPTTTLCFAVDDHGNLLSTATPASSTLWTPGDIDGVVALNGISCPTSTLCVAVDNAGAVLSSATPGTPSSWTGQNIDGSSNHLTAISCPTTAFCAAVDNVGQVFVSTAPPGTWAPAVATGASTGLTAISCTAAELCVATAVNGSVYASPDAGSSTPTWSTTSLDSPTALEATSCSNVGVCVLGDHSGNVFGSDTPAGAPPVWAVSSIDPGRAFTGISCLAAGLCVAVDSGGYALAATLAAPTTTTGTGTASNQTTATVTATVNPNDAVLSDCHFDYGTTTAYGSSAPCTVVPSATGGSQAVSAQLGGLNAGTTYHFQISASSGVAGSSGADATFATPAPLKPAPSLSGTAAVGNTLTCKANVTTTSVEAIAYQWLADTTPIAGATAATYTIAPTDASHHLSCQVTISGDGGSASATSGFDSVPSETEGKVAESAVGADKRGATSVTVPFTCSPQASGSCKVTLQLTATQTAHHTQKTVKVGSATASLAAGKTRKLTVSLNATGKQMLRNRHSMQVTLTVRGTIIGELTATLETVKVTLGAKAAPRRATAKARHAPRRAR
jgi:hypothetical protein